MVASQIGKELMKDSMNHIDELFRSQLGSAGVTPPPGVFEQCMNQLQTQTTQADTLNQSPTQNITPTNPAVATSNVGKTLFGLSTKAAVAVLTSVVAITVVSVLVFQKNDSTHAADDSVLSTNSANSNHRENAANSSVELVESNEEGALKTVDPKSKASSFNQKPSVGLNSDKNPQENKQQSQKYQTVLQSNSAEANGVGEKTKLGADNIAGWVKDRNSSETIGLKLGDNSTPTNRIQKVVALNTNPCRSASNQWKPVISDIVGGIVSLGIEGKFDKMKIDWSDGEKSEVVTDQVGVERVSHQYWVDHARTFSVKLLNERRILDDKGVSVVCKDSQRVAVNILPSTDATDIFVPDIFTPNGDGLNEEFYIGMAQPQMFDMCVFDMNNRLVFRSDKYDAKWKGICGSSVCPEGIYRVVVSYKYSGDKSLKYARKSVKLIYNSNR